MIDLEKFRGWSEKRQTITTIECENVSNFESLEKWKMKILCHAKVSELLVLFTKYYFFVSV
jgi:hypothetical protein